MQQNCHDGTKKPPIITAASHVASGLMLAPVASAQPRLTNAGPATWPDGDRKHTVVHVSSIFFFLNPNYIQVSNHDQGTGEGDLRQMPSIPHPIPNTAAPANSWASTLPFLCTRTDPTR
jgi:hypothetical protein